MIYILIMYGILNSAIAFIVFMVLLLSGAPWKVILKMTIKMLLAGLPIIINQERKEK